MTKLFFAVPALLLAGCAATQEGGRANPLDAAAKAPPVEYRSALEGYRRFADQELASWRRANDEVGASKPQPHGGHQ